MIEDNVQSKRESVDSTSSWESTSESGYKVFQIIPGRVELVSRGVTSPADEAAKRAKVEEEFGLRLVPLKDQLPSGDNTTEGGRTERLPTPSKDGEGQLGEHRTEDEEGIQSDLVGRKKKKKEPQRLGA